VRRLSSQLLRLNKPRTTIADLEASGKWMENDVLVKHLRARAAVLLEEVHDARAGRNAASARRVHDLLLSFMTIVDAPPNRPGCLRTVKCPGIVSTCGQCSVKDCLGNHFAGNALVLVHHKTQRSRDPIVIPFDESTGTFHLMAHYLEWARPLLVSQATDALFISLRGAAFESDSGFGAYLPRQLSAMDLPKLSFTTVNSSRLITERRRTHAPSPTAASHRDDGHGGLGVKGRAARRASQDVSHVSIADSLRTQVSPPHAALQCEKCRPCTTTGRERGRRRPSSPPTEVEGQNQRRRRRRRATTRATTGTTPRPLRLKKTSTHRQRTRMSAGATAARPKEG